MNINETIITVNDLPVKVIRKKIKNLHLAVYPPDGWVRIAVPEIIDDEAVRLAVTSKFGWIKRQIKSFEEQPRQSIRELITGESLYFQGKRYLLDVCTTEVRPYVELKNKKTITVFVNENTTFEQREKLVNNWYRKEMRKILPDLIKKWEKISGLEANSFGIKRMKTKWGSCNPSAKRIWLNLELIKKPVSCLEYIIVHEMVHFLERQHNNNFIAHMDRIMPQWRSHRDTLNTAPLAHEHWGY